jgi:hypothetical protein
MTAFEMASKFKWVNLTVYFNKGHVTVEGQTKIIGQNEPGESVWVGPVCLTFDTVVNVDTTIGQEGAKVKVHYSYKEAA